MTRILVLYYSAYGHITEMAGAVAEGVREARADVILKRIPELAARKAPGERDGEIPIATPDELPGYDAIVFGTPTRFGNMAAPMKDFLDQLSGLWAEDALVGRIGSVFTSSGSQHGGQEHTLLSMQASLMHLGMVVVGLPYTFKGQARMDEITGGSPYGATTIASDEAGGDRRPSANELEGARFQGAHVARIATGIRGTDLTQPAQQKTQLAGLNG
ncbi:NAD(P)H:quinone oxidoreductase [Nitratireductor luteus]|uniref:NAD(P)H:quinone oxidoreductase n=1 Tax=Nitratireductor luteus TaxID=2976980 RepID=UPI00223F126B|nr:NAD(P)H:quinone oxidoreductase [Nitratireductor luteus]